MDTSEVKEYVDTLDVEYRRHLTDLYNNTDLKVKDIIAKEKLPITVSQFRGLMVPVETDEKCEYCDVNMVYLPVRDRYSSRSPYCPRCGHKKDDRHCKCEKCENKRYQLMLVQKHKQEELARRKIDNIHQNWGLNLEPVSINDMTFKQKVMVGTLMYWSNSEDLRIIRPSSDVRGSIVPWNSVDGGFLEELLSYNILKVDVESDPAAFNDEGNEIIDIDKVQFQLNVEADNNDLENILLGNYIGTDEEKLMIWHELYVMEAIEYLLFRLELSKLSFNPGQKTLSVFSDISRDFSLACCTQMIYSGYKTAMTKISEGSYSKKHAINSIISYVGRYAINVRNGLWQCKGYNRDKRIPRSALSEYVYDRVIKKGDVLFELPVNEESLRG